MVNNIKSGMRGLVKSAKVNSGFNRAMNKIKVRKEGGVRAEDGSMVPKSYYHHSGKGTRARLETAAEKSFFKSKASK